MLANLPLARLTSPEPMLRAVREAGWTLIRLERLRDVEWARQRAGSVTSRLAGTAPQFAIVAETG